jgi:hypothetical protein
VTDDCTNWLRDAKDFGQAYADLRWPDCQGGPPYLLPPVVVTATRPIPWWVWALALVLVATIVGSRHRA